MYPEANQLLELDLQKKSPQCVNGCDDRHPLQRPIQGEQWTAVFAL